MCLNLIEKCNFNRKTTRNRSTLGTVVIPNDDLLFLREQNMATRGWTLVHPRIHILHLLRKREGGFVELLREKKRKNQESSFSWNLQLVQV